MLIMKNAPLHLCVYVISIHLRRLVPEAPAPPLFLFGFRFQTFPPFSKIIFCRVLRTRLASPTPSRASRDVPSEAFRSIPFSYFLAHVT
jgi:hypothetical protein